MLEKDLHRQNHFNLLRILLAAGVLLSHCFPLTAGRYAFDGEPWFFFTHSTRLLGTTCVLGFFVISGYLVSESFHRAVGLRDYFAARMLRIYPGAIACAALSALVIGPAVSTETPASYFSDTHVWRYVVHTGTFLGSRRFLLTFQIQDWLPGVFSTNPIPGLMNGSIWTIPWEILCYLLLVPVGMLLYRIQSGLVRKTMMVALVLCAIAGAWQYALRELPLEWSGLIVFWGFFSIGILARSFLQQGPPPVG